VRYDIYIYVIRWLKVKKKFNVTDYMRFSSPQFVLVIYFYVLSSTLSS